MGGKKASLVGQRFGRLVVRAEVPFKNRKNKNNGVHWLCVCDCGKRAVVTTCHLQGTRSCGCLKRDNLAKARIKAAPKLLKHGHASRGTTSRAYRSWDAMIQRCTNPNSKAFKWYGGRGIAVCDRWLRSFENFLADMGEPEIGLTLDRYPNNDGNYKKSNCRWATRMQQRATMRRRKPLDVSQRLRDNSGRFA